MGTVEQKYSLEGVSPYLMIVTTRDFPPQTTMALVETGVGLTARGVPFDMNYVAGNSIIQEARNTALEKYLGAGDGFTHLLMIDSDATFAFKDVMRLLCLGTAMPVVCAQQPYKREPLQWPLTFEEGAAMNEHGCVPVTKVGLPFMCVRRDVLLALAERAPKVKEHGKPNHTYAEVFRAETRRGTFQGEDTNFCEDVIALGHKVYLCPHIDVGHVGAREYKGSLLDALKKQSTNGGET